MLKNGFISGCLTVIANDFQLNHQDFLKSVEPLAKKEWKRFDDWKIDAWQCDEKSNKFETYYKLNEGEKGLFDNKSNMPKSFIEKFYLVQLERNKWNFFRSLSNVLYHKKRPDTQSELIQALIDHRLYKVQCSICNRTFFTDESSITCVKWRSCVGAACLSSTIVPEDNTYTNLCNVNNQSGVLQVLNKQLSIIDNINNPLSYYGGYEDLHVSYISDIHLLHHLTNSNSLNSLINTTIRNLYKTMDNRGIIVFAGDTSSDAELTIDFYTRFVRYNDYLLYKKTKKELFSAKNKKKFIDINKQKLELKINRFTKYIKALEGLLPCLDFNVVAQYKKRYQKDSTWVIAINAYKNIASYKNKNFPSEYDSYLDFIAPKLDLLEEFKSQYESYIYTYDDSKQKISNIESSHGKSIEELTISDILPKHNLSRPKREIFVVLGNHEYIGFNSVNEAIDYFKPKLEAIGMKLLHNNYYEFNFNGKTGVIFGGSGFAKYNSEYNADTLVCCSNFTRQDEIKESTLFEKAYIDAKRFADDKSCFVCVSHYPIRDCSATIDSDTIYFYGHNHQNFYHKNESETIYADNQIGYKNPHIVFKKMTTGVELNPYFSLADGLYKTTIEDYLQFYRHIGEYIGDGALLYRSCRNNKANIYVVKLKGYYGFFIMNPNKGASQGISIVNGGKTKKITKSTSLQWVFDNFEIVLCRYLQMLTPLRLCQEQISSELKYLGFSGDIHGCIVDVDFYHHIMLNPIDGTMTYYYSSSFGLVQPLASFENLIESIRAHDGIDLSSSYNYDWIQQQFNEKKLNQNYLLGKANETYLLETSDNDIVSNINMDEQVVSRSSGMYGISRKINVLQRLFSCHTLRDFDLRLVDSESTIENDELPEHV